MYPSEGKEEFKVDSQGSLARSGSYLPKASLDTAEVVVSGRLERSLVGQEGVVVAISQLCRLGWSF